MKSFFPWKRPLIALILACTLAAAAVILVAAGSLPAQSYDPIAEQQRRLDMAIKEKERVDGAIALIKPNIATLEKNLTELEATRERLTNLKQKLRGIQFWNAFVGSMGVFLDSVQKVNPGSSAVVATADFIQDRVEDALKDKDRANQLTMRIRALSETASRLSPRVRMVEKRISMTPEQVADELVARGMVQNDWLQGWNKTPDAVAKSDSVITGKITFIQEELGPAISEVENLISQARDLLGALYRELGALEKEAKSLAEEISDRQRNLELQGVLKEANQQAKAPPPNPITNPYEAAAKDYGAAAGEMNAAWSDLKAKSIDGSTYQARCTAARVGANKKMWDNLRPVSDQLSAVENWFWNQGGWKTPDGSARLAAAWRAYSAACARERNAYDSTVTAMEKSLYEEYQKEVERYRTFSQRLEAWEKTPIKIRYTYWSDEDINYDTTLRNAGWTGESLAWGAWAAVDYLDRLLEGSKYMPVGPLKGARERYDDWQKQVRETMARFQKLLGNMKSDHNALSGLASMAPALAAELEPNIEVWMYTGSWGFGYHSGETRELYRRLNTYQPTFNALSKAKRAKADDLSLEFNALDRKCSAAVSAIGGADAIQKAAVQATEAKLKTVQASRGQLDAAGTTLRNYLVYYGVSRAGIKTIEDTLQQIASPEKLEAHCLSLMPGEKEYDSSWKAVPTEETLEQMRLRYRNLAAKIVGDRQDYTDAYRQMEQATRDLDNALEKMRAQFREIEPAQVSFLGRDEVLGDVQRDMSLSTMDRYYLTAWTPDNPDDFADPNYGLQELMDRHRELVGKYHELVDPMLAKLKTEGRSEARRIQKLVEKVDAEGNGWLGLADGEFSQRINAISSEGYEIYASLANQTSIHPESAVAQAYKRLTTRLWSLSETFSFRQRLRNAAAELDNQIAGARNFLGQPESLGGRSGAEGWITALESQIQDKNYMKSASEVGPRLNTAASLVSELKAYINRDDIARKQAVTTLYAEFRQAYESRDDSAVVSLMSSDWSSDDGTTLADIQNHFRRIFSLYDEVRYTIQNLNVANSSPGIYQVSYDVTITSRIYRRNIKREEKSSVSEEVAVDAGGKARISRTLNGRFWYVQ